MLASAQDVLAQGGGDGLAGGAVAHRRDERGLDVVVEVEDQGFLAGEVFEQSGHRHVGGVSDVLDADLVVAALDEQPHRSIGQGLARLGLLTLSAPDWLAHAAHHIAKA